MKKPICLFFLFVLNSMLFSQELEILKLNAQSIQSSRLFISNNWKTELTQNIILISNVNIENQSDKNYKGLILKLYLQPIETISNLGDTISAYFMTEAKFKSLNSKASLDRIRIQSKVNQTPPSGVYNPILVVTNTSGVVMSYKILDSQIKSEDGNLNLEIPMALTNETPRIEINIETTPTKEIKISDELIIETPKILTDEPTDSKDIEDRIKTITDPDSVNKIIVQNDHSVELDKSWQIKIYPTDYLVFIKGGDILNRSDDNLKNASLDIFFSEEKIENLEKNFNGVKIATAKIGEILARKDYKDVHIKTNLAKIPKNGQYYMLLMLSDTNENGEVIIRAIKYFENPILF